PSALACDPRTADAIIGLPTRCMRDSRHNHVCIARVWKSCPSLGVHTSSLAPITAPRTSRCFCSTADRDPKPHPHPYDEIQFIQRGRGRYVVNGETFEAGAGDVLVIKAGEVHSFTSIGDEPLVQMDVHLSPRFIQENL